MDIKIREGGQWKHVSVSIDEMTAGALVEISEVDESRRSFSMIAGSVFDEAGKVFADANDVMNRLNGRSMMEIMPEVMRVNSIDDESIEDATGN